MNLKTTFFLLLLVAAGGALFWFGPALGPKLGLMPQVQESDAGTGAVLERELTVARLSRIDVQQGDRHVVLERGAGGEWSLPGRWPTRKAEVDKLVTMLTSLHSRFAPIPLANPADLKPFGLEPPPITVTLHAGDKDCRLAFGEEPGDGNRFSRPTYLRLDDRPEVVRLAPGLLGQLDRPQDYFQQRRLFPSDRIAKETDSQEKVERLAAKAISVKGAGASYALDRTGDDWELRDPVHDRPDPDKLQSILTALPDIWAEQFVNKKDLAELGLKEPEQTVVVIRPSGDMVTLLIGKQSQTKVRMVMRPAPPIGGPPMPPQKDVIHDEYRYAKLQDNDQVFEIKAERLKDIFVPVDTLRDARLARFRTEDAQRIELNHAGQELLLAKEKGIWRVQKPFEAEAENSKVNELLDKLSGLQAREKDVLDKADAKTHGLDTPAGTIKVTVEETKGQGDAKTKKTKAFNFALGKHDTEKSKIYVRLEGWERVNSVEDSVLKLVARPALAYRGRRVLDFFTNDLARIEVQRGDQGYSLEQAKGAWRLASPVQAEVDTAKVAQLAGDLSRLEAVEYMSEDPKPEEVDGKYGLSKPELQAKVSFADEKKPVKTLLIGKQRDDKPEYYARLDSSPSVFVVKKEIRETLAQDSLALLPLQLWQLGAEDIAEIGIRKEDQEYRLVKEGQKWTIKGPFEAATTAALIEPMSKELAGLKAQRYVAHVAKDLAAFGLDKPTLRVVLRGVTKEQPKGEADKEKPAAAPKERVLLIGKPAETPPGAHFAKLADGEAVFVLDDKVVQAVDRRALDLLDHKLLAVDPKAVEQVKITNPGAHVALRRQEDGWQVVESSVPPFAADSDVVAEVLGICSNLRAERLAAFGTGVDLTSYGLDKPSGTVTITMQAQPTDEKGEKPVEHTLLLGKPVDDGGARYARLDAGPGVAVLSRQVAEKLSRTYLDFVSRTIFDFKPGDVAGLTRRQGSDELELVRRDDTWHLAKPAEGRADEQTLDQLVDQLAHLRAKRVAAYPAKENKPYGLEPPEAVVTVRGGNGDGKPVEHVLRIGRSVDEKSGDRFAKADNSNAVVVVPEGVVKLLLAEPLRFRDRNLARFTDVDRLTLERGPRKAVFAKIDGTWKLTQPVQTEAEHLDFEDFINSLARLRAGELVADKAADLKVYGLDRPELRWHLQLGDKEIYTLLIGNQEKPDAASPQGEAKRVYGKLANQDLVFLLDPQLTTRALAEYRNRNFWPALDAAQIERLSFQSERPFVLEKVDNSWQLAGKPEVKLKEDAVRQTLDALASLRAERYVEDKAADLRLYGFEPPRLALEIQTRTDKRVLHIGRPEGDSRRYYARVADSGRAEVFIIGEADAARIVRTLADFGK